MLIWRNLSVETKLLCDNLKRWIAIDVMFTLCIWQTSNDANIWPCSIVNDNKQMNSFLAIDWLSFNVFRQQVVCWPFDSLILYLYIKSYDKLSAKKLFICLLSLTMLIKWWKLLCVYTDYSTAVDIHVAMTKALWSENRDQSTANKF
jgi:hypothetical protein